MKRMLLYLFDSIVIRLVLRVQRKLHYIEGTTSYFDPPIYKQTMHSTVWKRAVEDSASFVEKHLNDVLVFAHREKILEHTVQKIKKQKIDGVCLEFGVFKGYSVNYFAQNLQELEIVGFDSFEGLAEEWKGHSCYQGHFDVGGKLPEVRSNVTLVKGWFDQTVPDYCKNHLVEKSVRFVHLDSDTYSAAVIVLENLARYLKPGVLILFDDYIGYPNWQNGEVRAWKEISTKHKINFRYWSFSTFQALVEIVD